MTATPYDLEIEQGNSFALPLRYRTPSGEWFDWTGYEGVCQVRNWQSGKKLLVIDVEILGDPVDGRLLLSAPPGRTELFTERGEYDVRMTNGVHRFTLIRGEAIPIMAVSR